MIKGTWDRFGSLILAFVLALAVWVAAVNDQDPIEEMAVPESVPIEYLGLQEGLMIVGEVPESGSLTVLAPRSAWNEISKEGANLVHLTVNMEGLGTGDHTLAVVPVIDHRLASVVSFEPQSVHLKLENALAKQVDVEVVVSGEPTVGYRVDKPQASPQEATVLGPASAVDSVTALRTVLDVSGRSQDMTLNVVLSPVDAQGQEVQGVEVDPPTVKVYLPVVQRSGYKAVAVDPIITGQVEPGYRVTNITVTPTLVMVRSADPQLVDLLPGFLETEPIDLEGAKETVEHRVLLEVPQGFSLVGEQSVLVQVSIEAIESSIAISRDLEIQGLDTNLVAEASPSSVNVILTGPLPILEQLSPEELRVVLNLSGLPVGTHQVLPQAIDLPESVKVQNFLPESIEVTIGEAPEATPTASTP